MEKGIEDMVKSLLSSAGITVNGPGNADIQVKHQDFYKRILRDGTLGFGESYMDGWWDVKSLDELCYKIISASLQDKVKTMNNYIHYLEAIL